MSELSLKVRKGLSFQNVQVCEQPNRESSGSCERSLPGVPLPQRGPDTRNWGVAGSCSLHAPSGIPATGPYSTPARVSYCCGSTDWIWNQTEERYACGACQGMKQ